MQIGTLLQNLVEPEKIHKKYKMVSQTQLETHINSAFCKKTHQIFELSEKASVSLFLETLCLKIFPIRSRSAARCLSDLTSYAIICRSEFLSLPTFLASSVFCKTVYGAFRVGQCSVSKCGLGNFRLRYALLVKFSPCQLPQIMFPQIMFLLPITSEVTLSREKKRL